jgi:hypothetical protein
VEDAVSTLDQTLASETGRDQAQRAELGRVVVRLVDGESVQIGVAPNRDGARSLARRTIAELETRDGEWPLIGDRLLNPEAIVSVDVVS